MFKLFSSHGDGEVLQKTILDERRKRYLPFLKRLWSFPVKEYVLLEGDLNFHENGSFGLVLPATKISTRQQVAIKCVSIQQKIPKWRKQFTKPPRALTVGSSTLDGIGVELSSFSALQSSPFGLKLFDGFFFHGSSRYCFVMELCIGDLEKIITQSNCKYNSKLSPLACLFIITPIIEAVEHLHRHRIVHCDIKPTNVLLSQNCIPRLCGFGRARRLRSDGYLKGRIYGTRGYEAPEVVNRLQVDEKSDIWSIGITILYLIFSSFFSAKGIDSIIRSTKPEKIVTRIFRDYHLEDMRSDWKFVKKCASIILRSHPSQRLSAGDLLNRDIFARFLKSWYKYSHEGVHDTPAISYLFYELASFDVRTHRMTLKQRGRWNYDHPLQEQ